MKTMKISFSKLVIRENHRTHIDKKQLKELADCIKNEGLLQPVGVSKLKNGKYELVYGQRRVLACKILKMKSIDAVVLPAGNRSDMLIRNLVENMQRRDPSFAELGRMMVELHEKEGMKVQAIADRLGYAPVKISKIMKVYQALPEKLRRKVMFMEKGGGRKAKPGCLPADAANQIVKIKKDHGLNNKDTEKIFDHTVSNSLDKLDLNNVGGLISAGMTVEEAMKRVLEYGVYTIDVVIKHEEVSELMEENGLLKKNHLFKKIMYGELPPLKKPSWVRTGHIQMVAKRSDRDLEGLSEKRKHLKDLERNGKLTPEQKAALRTTQGLSISKFTDGQVIQIEKMYKDINEK